MKKLLLAGALGLAVVIPSTGATAAPSVCPNGWETQYVDSGDLFDKNNNNVICTKGLPDGANGEGNSANSQRGAGQTGYHDDGHNHMDDRPAPE
ncbi:MAG TPA: hypothetical protein VD931_05610 [Baekduia sp.]|nr:hypothetical protein [Baekduia sp.]